MPPILTIDTISAHVSSLLAPLALQLGLEIIELKITQPRGDVQIQVFADLPMGGIGIDECTMLNKELVEALDAAAVLPSEHFTVEVSSPGLDRPLKTSKDFLRNLNYNIRLFLKEPVNGKREAVGVLMAATATTVTLFTKQKLELVIPLADIERGLLIL